MRHSAGAWSGKTSEVPAFRNSRKPETASQFERLFRDAVSAGRFNRKVCPVLGLDSGTRFPLGMPSGKYIPF